MKKCPYCGAGYPDEAVRCAIDQTPLDPPAESLPAQPRQREYEFVPLAAAEKQNDLVTLVRCRTLVAADLVGSLLRSAGIEVFLPDEFLMQSIAWNLNAFGYVRVQVSPKDYDSARNLLSGYESAT